MEQSASHHEIEAWEFGDILLETYRYAPGKAGASTLHAHAEYQICISLDFPGCYSYRGASHAVPTRSLSILHPGERHASSDPHDREEVSHYRVFYLPPSLLQQAIAPNTDKTTAYPFFPAPVLLNADLFCDFLHLHHLLGSTAPRLEQECILQTLMRKFTLHHAQGSRLVPFLRPDKAIVRRVQAYIEAHATENLSLSELAQLVERHPVHLHQIFQQTVGMPPHVYQTQIRVERAKRLLARGLPIGMVAQEVGFYDQSHLGKYFRRSVGVTPAHYRALKTSYTA